MMLSCTVLPWYGALTLTLPFGLQERAAHTPLHMLLGGAIGVGLLAPGASIAVEEMPSLLPQQVRHGLNVIKTAAAAAVAAAAR